MRIISVFFFFENVLIPEREALETKFQRNATRFMMIALLERSIMKPS